MNRVRTIRDRKLRINNDRMLRFDASNSNSIYCGFDERHNLGGSDFTISLFINKEDAINGTLFTMRRKDFGAPRIDVSISSYNLYFNFYRTTTNVLTKYVGQLFNPNGNTSVNKIVHIAITRDGGSLADNAITDNYHIFINGREVDTIDSSNTLEGDGTFNVNLSNVEGGVYIGSTINGTLEPSGCSTGSFNNVVLLNKAATPDQIRTMHATGGVVPSELHRYVLNHWPLTQKQYKIKAWDVVEQYNYAKSYIADIQGARLADFDIEGTTTPVYTEGTDADGNYIQFDASAALTTEARQAINTFYTYFGEITSDDVVIVKVKYKVMSADTVIKLEIGGLGGTLLDTSAVGAVVEHSFIFQSNTTSWKRWMGFAYTNADNSSTTSSTRIYDVQFYINGQQPLLPLHGNLINFTDTEVGVDHPANNTSIISTLSKQISHDWGLRFDGVSQYAFQNPLTNIISQGENNWAIYIDLHELVYAAGNSRPLALYGTNVSVIVDVGGINRVGLYIKENDTMWSFVSNETFETGERIKLLIQKRGNLYSNLSVIANGIELTNSYGSMPDFIGGIPFDYDKVYLGSDVGGARLFPGIVYDVHFYGDTLTTDELNRVLNGEVISTKIIERIAPEKRYDTQINTLLGNQLLLQNFDLNNTDSYYVDFNSGLPEMQQALLMSMDTYSYSDTISLPVDSKEFTLTYGFVLNTINPDINTYLILLSDGGVLSTNNYIRIWGGIGGNRIVASMNRANVDDTEVGTSNSLQNIFKEGLNFITLQGKDGVINMLVNGALHRSTLAGTCPDLTGITELRINSYLNNSNNTDVTFYAFSFVDKFLTHKEILKQVDNTLYKPRGDELLFYNSNSENYTDDGTNVILANQGSLAAANLKVIGYAGATSAEQLTDVQNNLIDINTLR